MSRYASNTDVSSEKSRIEIERTLMRYGAGSFIYGMDKGSALIAFTMHERQIRFVLPMPNYDDFSHTPAKRQQRSPNAQERAWEQACRQRWRAMSLMVKAKLEAVESGIVEFENEFMAHIMLPDGQSVSDFMKPQIREAYISGAMPKKLVGLPDHTPKTRTRKPY